MKGELQSIELPLLNANAQKSQSKLQNYNNAAYVGSLLSSVLSSKTITYLFVWKKIKSLISNC